MYFMILYYYKGMKGMDKNKKLKFCLECLKNFGIGLVKSLI
jgi:hypothetical protein